ncbi:hypothetical protein PRIPAC_84720 [Pristionchus pacificus]|uniref:Uncharacterized protein n=1 Tax=Pristionchus pacificus TaxID=54126 RepID=A0A2A6BLX4_PRIPA|nr:hypothetical protein PRIPAC_84720 [Pristionchus pacificus]|eukprot:PDM66771.1 hypothetical protein PRIPAC_48188 [Pristionchus pacificus]
MSSCVHCNFCGVFPSQECTSFCLSNCGHVFCKECRDKGMLEVMCNRCSAAAPKFVIIDRNLNENFQVLFKKPGLLITEHSDELELQIQFQTNQRNLRFKGQQAQLKQEIDRRMGLENEVTTMRDEIRSLQRRCKEERSRSRSRHSSREDSRRSRVDVSQASHHQTMSSVGSNDSFLDPFKTPANGLKRFTTSTPKAHMRMEELGTKKNTEMKLTTEYCQNPRLSHSSTIPSLSSFAIEVDDDDEIMNVTPAVFRDKSQSRMETQQLLQMKTPLPSIRTKSNSKMMIDYDPILSGAPKPPLPKSPAPKKNIQSLTMAERLSGTRPKTPQKIYEGKPATNAKIVCGTPLVSSQLKTPAPITPIRPSVSRIYGTKKPSVEFHGSYLSSSVGAAIKRPEKPSAPSFKTPSLPMKKIAMPMTMPAGMKTGMANGGNPFP